jgi:hypothetical protein
MISHLNPEDKQMFRKILVVAAVAVVAAVPGRLIAGGPPWLCLPIDGVTAENAKACTELIEAKLGSKLWQQAGPYGGGATIRPDGDERYLTFYMQEDITLAQIEAALDGSEFSIPRDRLRLFGHVILEIDAGETSSKDVVSALRAMSNVSIAESQRNKDRVVAIVEMPYPVVKDRPKPESIGWIKFAKNDYSSALPSGSESPISRESLPSYDSFRDVLTKHNASLKDIRWSTAHACRALGCVTAPQTDPGIAAAKRTVSKSN